MSEPTRYPQLPFKIGLLSILIGPLAAAIVLGSLWCMLFQAGVLTFETGFESPPSAADLLTLGSVTAFWAYVVGIVPAAIAGFWIASQAGRTGRLNWRRGLVLGAAFPPICLLLARVTTSAALVSGDLLIPAFVAAAIGFVAAALTGIAIKLIVPELSK